MPDTLSASITGPDGVAEILTPRAAVRTLGLCDVEWTLFEPPAVQPGDSYRVVLRGEPADGMGTVSQSFVAADGALSATALEAGIEVTREVYDPPVISSEGSCADPMLNGLSLIGSLRVRVAVDEAFSGVFFVQGSIDTQDPTLGVISNVAPPGRRLPGTAQLTLGGSETRVDLPLVEGGESCVAVDLLNWQLEPVFSESFCPAEGETISSSAPIELLDTAIPRPELESEPESGGCAFIAPGSDDMWWPALSIGALALFRRLRLRRFGRRSRRNPWS